MAERVNVGLVGCGSISDDYLSHLSTFDHLEVSACADLVLDRARHQAARHGVPRACSVEELLADPDIELVVNCTTPLAHAEVGLAAIRAGKSVYNEKPFASDRVLGTRLLEEARAAGVRVGGAPDTFLGQDLETIRSAIDGGMIGEPVAATAIQMCHGHEGWHPDPTFYYELGGGPLFDMAPYALTTLVVLLGPVIRVTGCARSSFAERTIGSGPRAGETFGVNVPTHVSAILDFASGVIASIVYSFDVWSSDVAELFEIHGSSGTLSLPDMNGSANTVVRASLGEGAGWGEPAWESVPKVESSNDPYWGVGVADMAAAMREGRPHRASGELAFHVLDVMEAVGDAARERRHIEITSTFDAPQPMRPGWRIQAPSDEGHDERRGVG
jgi:predicted dehydrogenase